MSISDIVERLRSEVAERGDTQRGELEAEAMSALLLGAALPDGIPGALRLRVHRFIRGGSRFTWTAQHSTPARIFGAIAPSATGFARAHIRGTLWS